MYLIIFISHARPHCSLLFCSLHISVFMATGPWYLPTQYVLWLGTFAKNRPFGCRVFTICHRSNMRYSHSFMRSRQYFRKTRPRSIRFVPNPFASVRITRRLFTLRYVHSYTQLLILTSNFTLGTRNRILTTSIRENRNLETNSDPAISNYYKLQRNNYCTRTGSILSQRTLTIWRAYVAHFSHRRPLLSALQNVWILSKKETVRTYSYVAYISLLCTI